MIQFILDKLKSKIEARYKEHVVYFRIGAVDSSAVAQNRIKNGHHSPRDLDEYERRTINKFDNLMNRKSAIRGNCVLFATLGKVHCS